MRYLRYPFALTLLLTAAITGALLIGRAQPLPDRVAVLHLNDMCKLPCWIGITPGVTTLGEAEALVQSVYKTNTQFELIVQPEVAYYQLDVNVPNGLLSIRLYNDRSDIISSRSIVLDTSGLPISVGELYSISGTPHGYQTDFLPLVNLFYSELTVDVNEKPDFLLSPIELIEVYPDTYKLPDSTTWGVFRRHYLKN